MNNEENFRMMELGMQGYNCSQILMLMALEALGKENTDLVRAMSGLQAGMGCGKVCGALTGGCCVLGLFAGKDSAESNNDERLVTMQSAFVEWFETEFTARFGGVDCDVILSGNPHYKLSRCPAIVTESFDQLREILSENGYEFHAS